MLSRRAQHFVTGVESELPLHLTLRLEGFYKKFDRLPLNDSVFGFSRLENPTLKGVMGEKEASSKRAGFNTPAEVLTGFTNDGKGYAYGVGLLVQRRQAEKLNGWVSYSYTIARRSEYNYSRMIPPDFDIPHRVTVVATYDFVSEWQMGMKWQFASGRPYTPIKDVKFDTSSGYYMPIFGEPNSARLPAYHTLDVRLLKKWRFSSWSLVIFLEVLNTYARKNVADYEWNADYTERTAQTYMPTIPSIGIIAEF